jgi:hypothetical protein
MMTPKALAQLRRDYTQAKTHLAFLERCAASGAPPSRCLFLWRRRI